MKIIILFFLFIGSLLAQDELKEKLIRKHIVNDQIEFISNMFFNQQIEIIKENYPDIPDSVWTDVKLNVDEKDRLLKETIKYYSESFTLSELKEIDKAMTLPAMIKLNELNSESIYDKKFGEISEKCGLEIAAKVEDYLKQIDAGN